jgi:hypothetical protein
MGKVQAGTYTFTVTVSNGVSPDAVQNFTLTVTATPVAPTITSADQTSVVYGTGGTFHVISAGTSPIHYSLTGAPSGVSINGANGVITIARTVSAGTYTFTVTARSAVGSVSQNFTLTVTPAPTPTPTPEPVFPENPSVVLPPNIPPDVFPDIDFTASQPDPTQPGGPVRDAPPVPNEPDRVLVPAVNEEGETIFYEFESFDDFFDFFDLFDADVPLWAWQWDDDDFFDLFDMDVPLGAWQWDDDDEFWLFDMDVPLGFFLPPSTPAVPNLQMGDFSVVLSCAKIGAGVTLALLILKLRKRITR